MPVDRERLKWYICRVCGATFAFKYDRELHAMQTGHSEFDEKELNHSKK
ncbi:MAG: hypothetical protein AB1351_03310 [Thermoproteota archaeon]